jgi:hypothetical protein
MHAQREHAIYLHLLSTRRDLAAARRFFTRALRAGTVPVEVTTDRAPVYPRVLDEMVPSALHIVEQYANNPVEAGSGPNIGISLLLPSTARSPPLSRGRAGRFGGAVVVLAGRSCSGCGRSAVRVLPTARSRLLQLCP